MSDNSPSLVQVILAARSDYFRALLFGGMKESSQMEVELVDTSLPAFHHLLKYIYTGNMSLNSFKEDLILDILGLAHLYGFQDLECSISEYLKAVLSVRSVCLIYDTASLYQLASLSTAALIFMDRHALDIIHNVHWYNFESFGACRQLVWTSRRITDS